GQTVGISTTNFVLDVAGGLPEVIYTSEGNVYLHLPGVIVAESSTGETRYLLSDGLGSARQAVDENGAVVAYNEFDPYGNPVQNESGPYGFTGEWWEDEIGLLHLRARWYSVETGTFISKDPIEDEPPYQYVRGNPITLIDPSGYGPEWWDRMLQDDYWRSVLFDSAARHNITQMSNLDFAALMAAIIQIESGAIHHNPAEYSIVATIKAFEIWYNQTLLPKLFEPTPLSRLKFGYHTEGISNTSYETIQNLRKGLVPDAAGNLQQTGITIYEYSGLVPEIFPGLTPDENIRFNLIYLLTVGRPIPTFIGPGKILSCPSLNLVRQDQNIEYLAANLEAGAIRARWEGVEPTAEVLSWWHHRGIVTMRDERELETAIANAQGEHRAWLERSLQSQREANAYWTILASPIMQEAIELLRR
ncbi:MAG: RHS repeat-associated core domain-containing protein, partial [Nitrospira sp.]|nr:RHS repeat-associated core domain-containing protein [Nitrospira sp.]